MTTRRTISLGALTLSGFMLSATASAQFQARDIEAGPIWNQRHAARQCPRVCSSSGGSWSGNWTTTAPGRSSVCSCNFRVMRPPPPPPPVTNPGTRDVNAGPIWNQGHANQRCPQVCASSRGSWTGQWRTTVPGRMSVCECAVRGGFRPPPPPVVAPAPVQPVAPVARDIPAGPIWNQGHANQRCPQVCASSRAAWNGQWRTTVPGRMSVCGCVSR